MSKKNLLRLFLVLANTTSLHISQAASFDCTKASTAVEGSICANQTLSGLDDQLAAAYKQSRSQAADPSVLQKDQLAWLKNRNACGANVDCLTKAYQQRIGELKNTPSTATGLQAIDGNWYSSHWKYGYILENGIGTATSTNSPNFRVGDNIIQLKADGPNKFTGNQVYKDGKRYKVTAMLMPDGRLYFEGDLNAKWTMERIGPAPVASASVAATPAAAPPVDTSLFATAPVVPPPVAARPAATPPVDTSLFAAPPVVAPPVVAPPVVASPVAAPPVAAVAAASPANPAATHQNNKQNTINADFSVSAKELVREFKENKLAATLKYKNKKMLVDGVVKDIAPTKYQSPESVKITLAGSDRGLEDFSGVLVPTQEQIAEAVKLKKGDFIKLLCDGSLEYGFMNVDAKDCQLTSAKMAEGSGEAKNIDATAISYRFRTAERNNLESELVGKRVRSKIFFEQFIEADNSRRMLDANSSFFCDVSRTDIPSIPTNKGSYEIEGIFVVIDGNPGLSRCKVIR